MVSKRKVRLKVRKSVPFGNSRNLGKRVGNPRKHRTLLVSDGDVKNIPPYLQFLGVQANPAEKDMSKLLLLR